MTQHIRRTRGFTLVELMVVVAIIGVAGVVGLTVYQRSARSEAVPGMARALLGMVQEARHASLALGTQTRLRLLIPSGPMGHRIVSEQLVAGAWVEMATHNVPPTVVVCSPLAGAQLTTVGAGAVTCPYAADTTVCMTGSGQTTLSTDNTCPGTSSGATFFLRAAVTSLQPFKIAVYGITGLAKLLDRW